MALGKLDAICELCSDKYNVMSDEPHVCRLTKAERALLDSMAWFLMRQPRIRGRDAKAAQDYIDERMKHLP
jgi:hypothetical protein